MPRAWYSFTGPQTEDGYNALSNYSLLLAEPTCASNNKICAVYAIGNRVGGVQTANPTDITFVRSLFAAAVANSANQPITGGNNAQGRPYYVRVKP